jgi:cleavage stimulation factor subunit 3
VDHDDRLVCVAAMSEDPEHAAFFRAMQAQVETQETLPHSQSATQSAFEEYDPSIVMPIYEPSIDATNLEAAGSNHSSLSGSMPQSPSTPAVGDSALPHTTKPAASTRPRTIAGFALDDDDDDDNDNEEETVNVTSERDVKADKNGFPSTTVKVSPGLLPSMSKSPSNAIPQPDVSLLKAEEHAGVVESVAPKTQTSPSLSTVITGADTGANASSERSSMNPNLSLSVTVPPDTLPAVNPPTSAKVKERLPNDRVGALEDRIQADPRGDMDAWIGLIDEYRKRDKIDYARATYERFFQTFPHAV